MRVQVVPIYVLDLTIHPGKDFLRRWHPASVRALCEHRQDRPAGYWYVHRATRWPRVWSSAGNLFRTRGAWSSSQVHCNVGSWCSVRHLGFFRRGVVELFHVWWASLRR